MLTTSLYLSPLSIVLHVDAKIWKRIVSKMENNRAPSDALTTIVTFQSVFDI